MKFVRLILFCLAAVTCATAPKAVAEFYSIDWFTIDAGGGKSTGGVYYVSGTIGQPDASEPMTGGNFAITGGFWSLLSVVPTPGAPLLTITHTSTNTMLVSWSSYSSDFILQQNGNLNTTNWISPIETVFESGTTKFILVNPATGTQFYRLFKP